MPTPTSTYQVTNENGNILRTIPLVLGEVRQSGCELTNGSTVMKVVDSTELYVGMAVACYQVPVGTYIVAIKDATHVVLSAAATGTNTGLVGCFNGFNSTPLSKAADRGFWRNIISSGATTELNFPQGSVGGVFVNGKLSDSGLSFVPTMSTSGGASTITGVTIRASDELAASPALRTKTENWSFWTLISQGGVPSVVPFDPEQSVHLKSIP